MELFFSKDILSGKIILSGDEAHHCCRVLRHAAGDEIDIIDGEGNLYHSRIDSVSKNDVSCSVLSCTSDFGAHAYHLTMAVCPTKNIDRYEWMAQKCTEVGIDVLVPVTGDHSERKIVKPERLQGILLSAAKQSLKAKIPTLAPMISVKDFIASCPPESLKLIAYCFEEGDVRRQSVMDVLRRSFSADQAGASKEIVILIGPEGDFSQTEVQQALSAGFEPVHLGPSRLRTETAAVVSATAVYLNNL